MMVVRAFYVKDGLKIAAQWLYSLLAGAFLHVSITGFQIGTQLYRCKLDENVFSNQFHISLSSADTKGTTQTTE